MSEKDGSKSQEAATEAHSDGDIAVSDEGTEDAIFIPLGMARQCPRVFYKGSDVEWQSFIEFAHNKRRNHQIRRMAHKLKLRQFIRADHIQTNWLG